MKTTESNTVTAVALLTALMDAINTHDATCQSVHEAFNNKVKALESIRKAGFVDVQSGKDKGKEPLKGFYPYNLAADTFKAAFLKKSPTASATQIAARLKQDIISLKRMLQTGKFISNVGRETPKREFDFAISQQAEADMAAFTAKLLSRNTEQTVKSASKEAEQLKKQVIKAFESAAFVSACKDSTEEQKQAEQDKAEALAEQALVAEQKQAEAVKAEAKAKVEQAKAEAVKAEAKAKVEQAKAKVEQAKTVKAEAKPLGKVVMLETLVLGKDSEEKVTRSLNSLTKHLSEPELKRLAVLINQYLAQ